MKNGDDADADDYLSYRGFGSIVPRTCVAQAIITATHVVVRDEGGHRHCRELRDIRFAVIDRIGGRDTHVAVDDAFARRHVRTVIIGAIALTDRAFGAAPFVGMLRRVVLPLHSRL